MKEEKDFLEYLGPIEKAAKEEGFDSLDETYAAHLRARFFGEDVVIGESDRVSMREMKTSDLEAVYDFEGAETEPVLRDILKSTREETRQFWEAYIERTR